MEIMMRKPSMNTLFAGIAGLLLSTVSVAASSASGMATAGPSLGLGPVSGSAIITADIDLAAQPASIDFSVPEGAKITQVLLGWEGEGVYPSPGDENITVNGIGITGRLSGGPTIAFRSGEDQIQRSRFRADITSLALVRTGRNSLTGQTGKLKWPRLNSCYKRVNAITKHASSMKNRNANAFKESEKYPLPRVPR